MTTMHNGKTVWHERFYLYRQTDPVGVSGTGVVAEGVRFEDGRCVIRWCVPGKPRSTSEFDSIVELMEITGHGGSTVVMWLDTTEEPPEDQAGVTVHGKATASLGALV